MTDIVLPSDTAPKTVTSELKRWQPVFVKLLADTGISEEAFTANIAQAVRATPKLNDCNPSTVLAAGLRCAQFGLTPNDGRNLAWIIPRGNEATYQLGYGGVMKLARRAVPGLRFDGRPVYPNDEFELDYGKADPLTHVPNLKDRGGEAFAWYVRALFPDGSVQIQVLDKEGVEYHKNFSKSKGGGGSLNMWRDAYDAAALKSCVIEMKRWLDLESGDIAKAIAADGEVVDLADLEREQAENVGDLTPQPQELLEIEGGDQ